MADRWPYSGSMLTPAQVLGMVVAATLLSGCGVRTVWNDVLPPPPVITPAPPTPTPDYRTLHPYTGELTARATCVTASKDVMSDLEYVSNVGGAVRYTQGVAVRSNGEWWTVAVATAVDPEGDVDEDSVEKYLYFATNVPSHKADDWESEDVSWPVPGGSASATAALACLKKLPAAKDPFAKPPSPDSTYTGKLAPQATCKAVPDTLLARLQEVGQVGGAITYPQGQMVRANRKWWTVAVATRVHPNGQGYTSENVPAVEYFVTDAPSLGRSKAGAYYFPIKGKDRASAKALTCLKG